MSYTLSLQCGCSVYVACHPVTGVPHARILETVGPTCRVRRHEVGLRLAIWELLPDPAYHPQAVFVSDGSEWPAHHPRRTRVMAPVTPIGRM